MAGIKLKSGADFCNFQATRMCLHNDSADPTSDFGNGRIYFNTSSSVGSGKHVRIYDGSNFRSLAYFDEIDERLKLIEGSVDTSDLINNLADVQAFLKDIKESDGDLMTMLNGKLSTKGGTIEDNINTPLTINSTSTAGTVGLSFKKNGTEKGWVGYTDNQGMSIYQGGKYLGIKEGVAHFDGNTLIHEGNIGSYKAGGLAKSVTIWGQSFDGTGNIDASLYIGENYGLFLNKDKEGIYLTGTGINWHSESNTWLKTIMAFNSSGNVGIGTSTPTERLHVVGNLYVEGNIIADGEVSAGGAGTESGTGGGTSGGGDALIYSQEFTPSTQVVSIAHGLSATKGVIVQVWEKDTTAGSWNMVLVDVEEVDSNNIKLNFGRTETTLHKVVVMG